MTIDNKRLKAVIAEMIGARADQSEQAGGPNGEDQRSLAGWAREVVDEILAASVQNDRRAFRRQMILVGAIAIGAVMSADRKARRVSGGLLQRRKNSGNLEKS
jgi:hypothetical protein